jgi:hypothetical protein
MSEQDVQCSAIPLEQVQAAINLWMQAGKQSILTIHGWSMSPLLRDGDSILIDYNTAGIRPGDILAFRQGENLVIHRVIQIVRDGEEITRIVTKGDNNISLDPIVEPHQVIGCIIRSWRQSREIFFDRFIWSAAGWGSAALGRIHAKGLRFHRYYCWSARHPRVVLLVSTLPIRLALIWHLTRFSF